VENDKKLGREKKRPHGSTLACNSLRLRYNLVYTINMVLSIPDVVHTLHNLPMKIAIVRIKPYKTMFGLPYGFIIKPIKPCQNKTIPCQLWSKHTLILSNVPAHSVLSKHKFT
jgi:hypothetical protein